MSLLQAITCARIHQTRLLLDIGTNPNTLNKSSRTPLMLACFIDKQQIGVKIVKMLLEKGAKVSTRDTHRRTALSYACMNGRDEIVEILLDDIEYDINSPDDVGNTPLMYAAMSGNAASVRFMLQVLMKYRLSVDLRNNKGFSAYLLASKMGHFYCAHILKNEGYASDGIRDSEFFLSDKEWIRKTRKEIARMQLAEQRCRFTSAVSSPRISAIVARPQTSQEFRLSTRELEPEFRCRSTRFGAVSRLTTRSEPNFTKYNSWMNVAVDKVSRATSASSVGKSLMNSDSSQVTESVPSEARTKTPDLHAIFSHYISNEVYRPVKRTACDKPKDVRFLEEEPDRSPRRGSGIHLSPRQRKQSRMGPNRKKGVLNRS